MKKKYSLFLFFISFSTLIFGQGISNYTGKKILINSDNKNYTFCKTQTEKGKEIYILNCRYKLKKDYRSLIGDDADFMFTFYIIPKNNNFKLEKIKGSSEFISDRSPELQKIKEDLLLSSIYSSVFAFTPVIKVGDNYYKFNNCYIEGQAFSLQEDIQYFPKFGAGSNKFELNLLAKPYSPTAIDSLRKLISKDNSGLKPFGAWVEDFYDKWFLEKIDRKENTLDYWIDLKNISGDGYSFGRITKEITYKIGVGIINLKIIPQRPFFSDDYIDDGYSPVKFNFQEFVDLDTFMK